MRDKFWKWFLGAILVILLCATQYHLGYKLGYARGVAAILMKEAK